MVRDETFSFPYEGGGSWRRGWAGVGAIFATIAFVLLIILLTFSNRARDEALQWERRTYDVMLLARTVDATIARSEAALGRYVLDEERSTGTLYYNEWRQAGRQIQQLKRLVSDGEQRQRVRQLEQLYQARGRELALAATAAAGKRGSGGVPLFYQAGRSPTGPELRTKLEEIAANERDTLRRRMEETSSFARQAENFSRWLGWLGLLLGIGAIVLAILAYRAFTDRLVARRLADSEASRAQALEQAVEVRTRELREANERLRAEAAEREAAEAQLRQVQKMEAIGQLTGGIAHDFNNMLAIIVGGLDMARRKLHGPKREIEIHLESAMEGAARAAALTRRLLAFARSDPLIPQAVDPTELVQNMLDLVDRSIGERINVQTVFSENSWRVWADPNQLENAILNLCVNARDAMNGEGQLTIRIQNIKIGRKKVRELAPGEYVCISVTDEGVGISPENLDRVFEPFFTTKPVGKGTGLGLSQIFGFARQSGGDVIIDSAVGEGTTVTIYLPRSLKEPEQFTPEFAHGSVDEQAPACVSADTVILVVEDDPRVSRSTVTSLEELGYETIACATGAEAIRILEEGRSVRLLLTDVMMPEMTGPELVRIVSEHFPEVVVLFVTGYVGEAGEGEDLSGYPILRKPFTVSGLARAVSAALSSRVSGSHPASASEAAE